MTRPAANEALQEQIELIIGQALSLGLPEDQIDPLRGAIQANPAFFVGFVRDLIENTEEAERQQAITDFIENFDKFNEAAIIIQKNWRGTAARELVRNRFETEVDEYYQRNATPAAIKLQAAFRGYKARKEIKDTKETAAATIMQAAARAFLARRRSKEAEELLPKQLPETYDEYLKRDVDADPAARRIQEAWRNAKLRKTKEVNRLSEMLEAGFPKPHDRQTLIDKELFGKTKGKSYAFKANDKGRFEFIEARIKDQERLKSDLTYLISGYSASNPSQSKLHKSDHITLEKTGLSFATFDVNNGGLTILQRQIDKARLSASRQTDPNFSSFTLVKMQGDLRRPVLDQNGNIIFDEVLDEKGKTVRQVRTVVEVETPYSIIHQKGKNLSHSFVKPTVIEKMMQDLEQKMEAQKRIMLRAAILQFEKEPDGAEKDAKILAVVRSSLRLESEKAFEKKLQESRDLTSLHYENSKEAIEKLRVEYHKKFKSKESQKFLREIAKVDDPKGPGITINKSSTGYNVKVSFFRKNVNDEIFDIAYIAIPRGGNVRVQTALNDGVLTRYVNGKKQEVQVKAGEVVMDENTLVYFNERTKSYDPVKVLSGRSPSKEMKQFFRVGNDASYIAESYSKMNIEAISILGPDLSIAIQRNGKSQTLSSMMPKVAYQGEKEEKLVLIRRIPKQVSFENRGFEIDGHRAGKPVLAKIPQFDLSIFQVDETVKPGIGRKAITNPALKSKEELQALQESAAKLQALQESAAKLRIRYNRADRDVVIPGQVAEVKAGEFYFNGIVDEKGNPVPKEMIIQQYGQKFYDILVKTELGIVRKDEIKKQEQEFRKAAENGDVETVKRMVASYQEKLQETIALVNSSRGEFKGFNEEEQKALKAKMVAEIMANSAPNIFADNGSVLKGQKNALHLAAANGHGEVVEALLEAGFDPNVRTTLKANASDIAKKAGFKDEEWFKKLKEGIQEGYQDQTAQERESAYFQAQLGKIIELSGNSEESKKLEEQEQEFIKAIQNSNEGQIDKFFAQYQERKEGLDSLIEQMKENGHKVSYEEERAIHTNYNFDRELILGALNEALKAKTSEEIDEKGGYIEVSAEEEAEAEAEEDLVLEGEAVPESVRAAISKTPGTVVSKPTAKKLQGMIMALGGTVDDGASR